MAYVQTSANGKYVVTIPANIPGPKGEDYVLTKSMHPAQTSFRAIKEGREFFLKVFATEDRIPYFQRERQVLQMLGTVPPTPNIILPIEMYQTDSAAVIVLPFENSIDLYDNIKIIGPFSVRRTRRLLEQMLDVHNLLHSLNFYEGDIRADNILVSRKWYDKNYKRVDFGITVQKGEQIDKENYFIGENHSAPEVRANKLLTRDELTEVYQIGLLTHHCLTGKVPFPTREAANEKISGTLTNPRDIDPSIPAGVARVVTKATMTNRNLRFQTIQEFVEAFSEAEKKARNFWFPILSR